MNEVRKKPIESKKTAFYDPEIGEHPPPIDEPIGLSSDGDLEDSLNSSEKAIVDKQPIKSKKTAFYDPELGD